MALFRSHRWGVVLAGGDGSRLRAFTRQVCGDDRPKQFCPLLGGQTLLDRTRARVERVVSPERTLYVLARPHEPFYSRLLADVPVSRRVVQETNRGTLPAILSGLATVVREDPEAVVAFFPSDHHYRDEARFLDGLGRAFDAAESSRDTVILLGAAARSAESSYGYIEPEAAFRPVREGWLRSIRKFWEKPGAQLAQCLIDRGCLWNTFVMVGRARAFLDLIGSAAPRTYHAFRSLFAAESPADSASALTQIYRRIRPSDFSKRVLSSASGSVADARLAVLNLGDVGWTDLGEPDRVRGLLDDFGKLQKLQSPVQGLQRLVGDHLSSPV